MESRFSATQSQLQTYLKLAEGAMRAGDMSRALAIGHEASVRGLDHPNLLVLAAHAELNAGAPENALGFAQRARALAPQSAEVRHVLALSLAQTGKQKEALAIYDAALRNHPGVAQLRYHRGCLLDDMFETEKARRDFERTLELDPSHAGAMTRLATIAAANGQAEVARSYADRVLKRNPGEAAAVIALTQADLQEEKYESVIARITSLAAPKQSAVNRSIAQGLIADALDAMGKKAEAFAAYTASNQILKESVAPTFEMPGNETALARAERIADAVTGAARMGTTAAVETPVKTHVFLLGFPRSGTTLLENVLASHPAIETVEERDGFMEAETDYFIGPNGFERLYSAGQPEAQRYRDAYWAAMEEGGARFDCDVFIDKMPLNSLLLPVIAKLFPASKILLAIRDPRDVVLSCFRRRFGMSAKMYPMLSLDSTARFYDAAMRICAAAREKFPMPFRTARYEDLVTDFARETGAVCQFLDVEPRPEMAQFADRAKGRLVNTPSATQVSQGLYMRGIDQWRAYHEQMSPVLPMLARWVKEFGYAEE